MNEYIFQRIQEQLAVVYKTFKNITFEDVAMTKIYNDTNDMFIELIQQFDNLKNENHV